MRIILHSVLLVIFCCSLAFASDDDFKKIDANNDGKISRQEYNAAVIKTFQRYDRDGDGYIEKKEMTPRGAGNKTGSAVFLPFVNMSF